MSTEILTLRDPATGSSAQILPALGFNCFRFTAMPGGKPVEVIYSHPEFAAGGQSASGSGIPVLFPFPGRIPGTTFEYKGKKYELPAGDGLGNAIHGLVHTRRWRVLEKAESFVIGQFHAWRDDESVKPLWPEDFAVCAYYTLKGNSLQLKYVLENPGAYKLPFGFGIHPYFRVPLGGKAADKCLVKLPVSSRYELKDMLPVGAPTPLADAKKFQKGQKFGDLKLDDVFSGLVVENDRCQASIEDPSGCTVTVAWDKPFRECVVYTPPHREAICIEPYTCAPCAAALAVKGIDSGWGLLPAGDLLTMTVDISVSEPAGK